MSWKDFSKPSAFPWWSFKSFQSWTNHTASSVSPVFKTFPFPFSKQNKNPNLSFRCVNGRAKQQTASFSPSPEHNYPHQDRKLVHSFVYADASGKKRAAFSSLTIAENISAFTIITIWGCKCREWHRQSNGTGKSKGVDVVRIPIPPFVAEIISKTTPKISIFYRISNSVANTNRILLREPSQDSVENHHKIPWRILPGFVGVSS